MSGWLPGFLLALAPLLVLVASLISGRYPGEVAIQRCRRVIALLFDPHRKSLPPLRPASAPTVTVRGGRLIASSLAGRAPPLTFGINQLFSM